MARFVVIGMAVIGGLMLADVLTHPQGVAAAATGAKTVETPVIKGLLGSTSGY